MFEKQSSIKDMTVFKNKLDENLPEGFTAVYDNNSLTINNKNGRAVFVGKIGITPIGCRISGEFPSDRLVGRIAMVLVAAYIAFLLFTYAVGPKLYDYQIFIMILGVLALAVMKRANEHKASGVKKALDEM